MLSKTLFNRSCGETFHLRDAFIECIGQEEVAGIRYKGEWMDNGTPERLQQLDMLLNYADIENLILELHPITFNEP